MNLATFNELDTIRAAKAPLDKDAEPTKGYKMFGGFFVNVHHPAGTIRRGIAPDGTSWATRMHNDYGELPGSVGADNEPVDCFLGPKPDAKIVHVIHMNDKDGNYNEDKAMIGFASQQAAVDAFRKHYPDGTASIGAITSHRVPGFRKAVRLGKTNDKKMLHASGAMPGPDAEGTQDDADKLMEYRSFGDGEPAAKGIRKYQRGDKDRVVHVKFKDGKVHKSRMTYHEMNDKGTPTIHHGWKGLYSLAQSYGD